MTLRAQSVVTQPDTVSTLDEVFQNFPITMGEAAKWGLVLDRVKKFLKPHWDQLGPASSPEERQSSPSLKVELAWAHAEVQRLFRQLQSAQDHICNNDEVHALKAELGALEERHERLREANITAGKLAESWRLEAEKFRDRLAERTPVNRDAAMVTHSKATRGA